jgi:superfamily II DNA or RNA helicase
LTEGVDLPSANCALFARLTKSQIVYSQAIGRITRRSPETGKTDGLVLDMVGAANQFDLVTLWSLFGLRELKDGEEVIAAKKREKKEDEEAAAVQLELAEMAEGEVVGREVNLFGGRQVQKRGIFEWHIDTVAMRSKLHACGHTFEIWREGNSDWYGFADMHWQGTLNGRTFNYLEARARIEEEARRLLFGDKDAPWRSAPASPKQIELLTRFRIPIRPDITKGEASDLLDAKFKKARAA